MPPTTVTVPIAPAEAPAFASPARGLASMLASSCFFAGMAAFIYAAQTAEPESSPLVSSFARIVVNLAIVVAWAVWTDGVGGWRSLWGDRQPALWLRGIFGSAALICSFASVKAIGVGESSFLHASNGVFIALLAPLLLGQRNSARAWIAVVGAIAGLALLFEPRVGDVLPFGRTLALASGLLSALAYLMIARAGRKNSPTSVIFYLCITALVMHLGLFATLPTHWPTAGRTYALLAVAGVLGSIAQVFLTRAYQLAPAALCSAVAYSLPVMNLAVGAALFGTVPDTRGFVGAALVLGFGVVLPFARRRATEASERSDRR